MPYLHDLAQATQLREGEGSVSLEKPRIEAVRFEQAFKPILVLQQ